MFTFPVPGLSHNICASTTPMYQCVIKKQYKYSGCSGRQKCTALLDIKKGMLDFLYNVVQQRSDAPVKWLKLGQSGSCMYVQRWKVILHSMIGIWYASKVDIGFY